GRPIRFCWPKKTARRFWVWKRRRAWHPPEWCSSRSIGRARSPPGAKTSRPRSWRTEGHFRSQRGTCAGWSLATARQRRPRGGGAEATVGQNGFMGGGLLAQAANGKAGKSMGDGGFAFSKVQKDGNKLRSQKLKNGVSHSGGKGMKKPGAGVAGPGVGALGG